MVKEADVITAPEVDEQNSQQAGTTPLPSVPHIDPNLAHDLDGLLERVLTKHTTSTVGFNYRLAKIAESYGRLFTEVSILIRLRCELHLKEDRYTKEQTDEITDSRLRLALGLDV